ncbi:helix-turn-helix domain-containing protein [Lactococcus sp. DD01]|uniref:helix-turn-helix domain-containing protein n=1 Tax=Lactococcus sp. DD01 TaxID=1776443 RepID=UPI0007769B6F|nr:helix-turn-helix transcriptional regulator [Lactococcus sp. DD01]KXT61774.1 hypothetical protein LACDD01_01242 [Lactococcus sp. DD01]
MTITSDRIHKSRVKSGMSRAELSREIEVSKTTIQKWEEGITAPRRDKIKKLSQAFNVSEKYLLGFSNFENDLELLNEAVDIGKELTSFLGINVKSDKSLPVSSNELYQETREVIDNAFNIPPEDKQVFEKIIYNFLLLSNDEREDIVEYSEFVLAKKGYIIPKNKDN